MSESDVQLNALQGRILTALDRIGDAVAGMKHATPTVDPDELAALTQALDDEKSANIQLVERLKALDTRQEEAARSAEKALAEQKSAMVALDKDLQRLRAVNDQLRDNNRALREANETGVGDAHLINKSMMAELEALRAARAADQSESEAIISALTPLVANGASGGQA